MSAALTVEEAAKRLGQPPDRLAAWEPGEERLSVAQLRDAARVYKRPLAVFYLPEPPRDFQPLRDFRRLPDAEAGRCRRSFRTRSAGPTRRERRRSSCASWLTNRRGRHRLLVLVNSKGKSNRLQRLGYARCFLGFPSSTHGTALDRR